METSTALQRAYAAGAKPLRPGTKQAQLIALLEGPAGASIQEIVGAFGRCAVRSQGR